VLGDLEAVSNVPSCSSPCNLIFPEVNSILTYLMCIHLCGNSFIKFPIIDKLRKIFPFVIILFLAVILTIIVIELW
jgi:hypothetical protein